MPDGTSRFSIGKDNDPSLHGLLDVLELHGAAGDRGGEDSRRRAVRQGLLHRLRRDDRHRRGDQHGEGRAGRERRRVRPRRHRPERRSRARGWPAPTRSSASTSIRAASALAEKFGMTHFVNPKEVGGDLVAHLVSADRRRRRLQLRVRRQRRSHAPGARVLPSRLGRLGDHRRRRRRAGDQDAAVPAGHGRVWKGTAFGGARGRTDVPKIVDWYMDGKINIDDLITHTMPLEQDQRCIRSDAQGRIDSQRRCCSERAQADCHYTANEWRAPWP